MSDYLSNRDPADESHPAIRPTYAELAAEVARLRAFFSAEATGYERLYDEQSAQLRALWPLARAAVAYVAINQPTHWFDGQHVREDDDLAALQRATMDRHIALMQAAAALPPDLRAELEADHD